MKRVLIFSLHDYNKLKKLLTKRGFQVVKNNPDFILVYGGDGSALLSERLYPSIPKLLVKSSSICRQCDFTFQGLNAILPRIKEGRFKIRKEMKLEAQFKNKKLTALNEIQIHTKLPIRAVRFSLAVNGRKFEDLIGDGVIVATPFGSSAYYSSVGGRKFSKGIGIAFNNLHNKKIRSFTINDKAKIRIKMSRDNALLAVDNDEKVLQLKPNDTIAIRKSTQVAKFITV